MKTTLKTWGGLVLAATAMFHPGCAMTDYAEAPLEPGLNKSHGIIACESDDRFANAQQVAEKWTRDLFYTELDPATGDPLCDRLDSAPPMTDERVDRRQARDWNRFLGSYAMQFEFEWTGAGPWPSGTWLLGGVADMADGSRRINNFYTPDRAFSCVGASVNGRAGAAEGVIFGDGIVQPGASASRLANLRIDCVTVDRKPGFQACRNVIAVHPDTAVGGGGCSYYWAQSRAEEGRLEATPVTRREGLSEFLSGGTLEVEWQGVRARARGEIREDGRIDVLLLSLGHAEGSYEAVDPIRFTVDPMSPRTVALDGRGRDRELAAIAQWALDTGHADRTIELGGFVPEVGLRLPEGGVLVRGDALRRFIDGVAAVEVDGG